jgi:hypothetical protein
MGQAKPMGHWFSCEEFNAVPGSSPNRQLLVKQSRQGLRIPQHGVVWSHTPNRLF